MKSTKSRTEILREIAIKLTKKNKSDLSELLSKLSEKKEKEQVVYEHIPAKLIINGKKYHTVITRPVSSKLIPYFLLK
jgi:hypothetical protein